MTRAKVVLLLVSLVALSGCKPTPGGSCKVESKEVCVDDKKALACHDGKWEEMLCRGPDGCSKKGGDSICDQSVAEDKDVCNLADDYVCTADKKAMLQCVKGRWTNVQSCLGQRGCQMEAKRVTCDNSLANLGDPCRDEEDYACAASDQKSALVCRGGKFVQSAHCKGPKGCRVTGDKASGFKVECDDTIAAVGDACEKDDHFTCTADERTIVRCRNKKFEVEDRCKPREKCQIRGGLVGCY